MKIYFAGSIRCGREDSAIYAEIIELLSSYGKVLTEHVGNKGLTNWGEVLDSKDIFDRDMKWLKEADVLIAKITVPSTGVGYEIACAEAFGKKSLCIYRPQDGKRISAMVEGNRNVSVKKYKKIEDAKEIFDEFFKKSKLCK